VHNVTSLVKGKMMPSPPLEGRGKNPTGRDCLWVVHPTCLRPCPNAKGLNLMVPAHWAAHAGYHPGGLWLSPSPLMEPTSPIGFLAIQGLHTVLLRAVCNLGRDSISGNVADLCIYASMHLCMRTSGRIHTYRNAERYL